MISLWSLQVEVRLAKMITTPPYIDKDFKKLKQKYIHKTILFRLKIPFSLTFLDIYATIYTIEPISYHNTYMLQLSLSCHNFLFWKLTCMFLATSQEKTVTCLEQRSPHNINHAEQNLSYIRNKLKPLRNENAFNFVIFLIPFKKMIPS